MGEENKSDITITYETLFELLRREKNRDELQKLQKTFYDDVVSYLNEKNKILMPESADLFSDNERDKTIMQMKNAKRMVKELFERREKKIIIMALNKARTPSSVIDKNSMLDTEILFFDRLVSLFIDNKNNVLQGVLGHNPLPVPTFSQQSIQQKPVEKPVQNISPPPQQKNETSTKMVMFISPVPKFLGTDGEVFGPYEADDIASLPARIADVLIKKRRAEEMITE